MKNFKYKKEYDAHQKMLKGERLSLYEYLFFIIKIPFSLIEGLLRNIPGPIGFKLRYIFYKPFLKRIGKNVLIDVGVKLGGIRNISIGDYCYIESYTLVTAFLNEVQLGNRVHVGPFCIIHANGPIKVGDYVGIAPGVKIFSSTTYPNEKRMSGPTVPKEMMSMKVAGIEIEKDAAIYSNSTLLPGAKIGEGVVVCANSVISKPIEPYRIVIGQNKLIGKRKRVTEKDI